MTLYSLDGASPKLPEDGSAWVAPNADLMGQVQLGKDVSIWFHVVARGDNELIRIGNGSNVQEHTMIHTDPGYPATIGENCTIGHRAIIHGCTIGDGSLVGMGAIILNGAKIGKNCLIGAGALVPENKEIPDGSLVMGMPGKVVRALDDVAVAALQMSAKAYQSNGRRFKKGLKPIEE
ncbi:MAG: gamma carbonic anhydrase family protein [Pseudomonadota bacterium]